MQWFVSCVFATLVVFLPLESIAAPSFDCRQAGSASERAICGDSELAELDAEMAKRYAQVRKLAAADKIANIVAQQRAWLKRRAACGSEVDCLRAQFLERIDELESERRPADRISTTMDCNRAIEDMRKVSDAVEFGFKQNGKIDPSRQLQMTYSGAAATALPMYIVIDLPVASRLFGKGFLSLTANARSPDGLRVALDRVRAIIPLNAGTKVEGGSIGVRILAAGMQEVGFSIVTGGQCGEQLLRSQRIPVTVQLGPPELVVYDVAVGDQPQSVSNDSSGALSLNVYTTHYEVLDRATGSLLLRRPGLKPRFSPTGRFVVAVRADDQQFEVVDVLDGSPIGQFPPGVLAWARNDSFIVAGGTSRTSTNITMSSLNPDMKFETAMANQQAAWWDDEMILDVDRLFFAATTVEGGAFWDLVSGDRSLLSDPDRTAALRRIVMDRRGVEVSTSGPRWRLGEAIRITHDDWLEFGNVLSAAPQDFVLVDGDRGIKTSLKDASFEPSDPCEKRRRGLARADEIATLCAQEITGRGLRRVPNVPITAPEEIIFERIANQTVPLASAEPAEAWQYGGWWDDNADSRAKLDKLVAGLRRTAPPFDKGVSLLQKEDMAGFGNCRTSVDAFDPRHIMRSWQWTHTEDQAVVYLECHMGSGWLRFANLFLISGGKVKNLSLVLMSDGERAFASEGDETAQSVFGRVDGDGSDVQVTTLSKSHLLVSSKFSGRAAIVDRQTGMRLGALLPITDATLLRSIRMTQDERYLVQLNQDGRFFILRASDGAQVLLGAHVDDEIVVMAPDGRFDTSYEGAHSLYFRFSGLAAIQTVHQYRSVLHRPGLAKAVLGGRAVVDRPEIIGVPPIVNFSLGEAVDGLRLLTIEATDDSLLASAQLMVDGRLVAKYPLKGANAQHTVEIKDPGGGRWVTVVATDHDGLSSSPKAILLPSPIAKRGALRAILVGIDAYRKGSGIPRLQFARSDAERLNAALSVSVEGYENQFNPTILLDEEASRSSILLAVREAVAETTADDTLIFSFAGHAIGSDESGQSGKLLLALVESRIEDLQQSALLWRDVAAELKQARGRVLVLLDACHSGLAGGSSLVTNDDLANELVSGTGASLIVLAASKGRQVALEDGRKGGGIFTSALVDALTTERGVADTDSNGAIDLGELYSNVKSKVLIQTGGKQSPWLARNLLLGDMRLF